MDIGPLPVACKCWLYVKHGCEWGWGVKSCLLGLWSGTGYSLTFTCLLYVTGIIIVNEVHSFRLTWEFCEMIPVKYLVQCLVTVSIQCQLLVLFMAIFIVLKAQFPWPHSWRFWYRLRNVDFIFNDILHCIKPSSDSGLWFSIWEPLFSFSVATSCHLNSEMKVYFTHKLHSWVCCCCCCLWWPLSLLSA